MRTVRDIPQFENSPILVRAALNVPIENGTVANAYRIRRAVPTIDFLRKKHARVILISHLGEKGTETLAPVAKELAKLVPGVSFCKETIGAPAREAIRAMRPGEILVLENLRRDPGERANSPAFAKEIAALADVFVEDSFDTCHREHASIVGVPQLLPSYAGLLLEEEIRELSSALTPKQPGLAAIGGAKFSTKEPVLTALLGHYDSVFVSGALANDFLRAAGYPVGKSLTSTVDAEKIKKVLANPHLVLPVDVRVIPAEFLGKPEAKQHMRITSRDAVQEDEVILDHGPATEKLLSALAQDAHTILWNGPFGKYEDGFGEGTDAFAQAVAASDAHSVVGGGDTIAAIEKLHLLSRLSFVSTGGGSMLEFLAHGTLPGITALDAYASA